MSELQDKVEALRAARAERERRRAEAADEQGLADALEYEQRRAKEDEILEGLEAEHGPLGKRLAEVDTPMGRVFLKPAHRIEFDRFTRAGKYTPESLWDLCKPCILYPTAAEFTTIRDAHPLVLSQVADALTVLAGARRDAIEGK